MTFFDIVNCPVEFQSDAGKIVVRDGVAAGGSWLLVAFTEGSMASRKIWMMNDAMSAEYFPHAREDGFLFNVDTSREISDTDTVVEGGEFDEALKGFVVNLV